MAFAAPQTSMEADAGFGSFDRQGVGSPVGVAAGLLHETSVESDVDGCSGGPLMSPLRRHWENQPRQQEPPTPTLSRRGMLADALATAPGGAERDPTPGATQPDTQGVQGMQGVQLMWLETLDRAGGGAGGAASPPLSGSLSGRRSGHVSPPQPQVSGDGCALSERSSSTSLSGLSGRLMTALRS